MQRHGGGTVESADEGRLERGALQDLAAHEWRLQMDRLHDVAADGGAHLAARCVEHALGIAVVPRDIEGVQGSHDFDFDHGRVRASVEAKTLVDSGHWQASAEAARIGYQPSGDLTLSWNIRVEDEASYRKVNAVAPRLLAELEALGVTTVAEVWHLRHAGLSELATRVGALGITSAYGMPPTAMHPGGYYVLPEGRGGGVPGIDQSVEFVCKKMAGEWGNKLRSQLRRVHGRERHAFIVIGMELLEAHALMNGERPVPTRDPVLPDPVDALWITGTSTVSEIVHWNPRDGWATTGPPPT